MMDGWGKEKLVEKKTKRVNNNKAFGFKEGRVRQKGCSRK